MPRRFSKRQRTALYIASGGKCEICGEDLKVSWHADHVKAWSKGGDTDVINGQSLCGKCNMKKGVNKMVFRKWQEDCVRDWHSKRVQNYLIAATPGAGKTNAALKIARESLDSGVIERLVVVVPTEYLKYQWTASAKTGFDIELDPYGKSGIETTDFDGMVTTYQSVAVGSSDLHRMATKKPTMVIFDEIHHAGEDGPWGESLKHAFEYAVYRIGLSGTPFRSDSSYIPFVTYEQQSDGVMQSKVDWSYTYGDALRERVLKEIDFIYIDALSKWNMNGIDSESKLSEKTTDKSEVSRRLKTAVNIDSHGLSEWMIESLSQANAKLEELRSEIRDDSGGIVFVEDQFSARQFETNKRLHDALGEVPTVVYSDKPDSGKLIDRFRKGKSKWIVSVRQISEGVDIPRLAVCVYATIEKTELIFRQRIARILRVERKYPENMRAYAYIPADLDIVALARVIEQERDHVIESDDYETEDSESQGGERQQFDFIPGQTVDVQVAGVISGAKVYKVPIETAKRVADATGVSIDVAIKVLHAYIDSQTIETPETKDHRSEQPLADYIVDLKQGEDRIVSKLSYKISGGRKEGIGDAKKQINTALYNVVGKAKKDCTVQDLSDRKDALLRWVKDGYIS